MSHPRNVAAASDVLCVPILHNWGETWTRPFAWASCGRGWEQPIHWHVCGENRGQRVLPPTLFSSTVPTVALVPLTRDTSLLTGTMPGRMLLPGFSDTCMSSGMKKDSLYQISNSARRQEDSMVRCWGGPEDAGKASMWACHRLTPCSLLALGSHPFPSPPPALRVLETLWKPLSSPSLCQRAALKPLLEPRWWPCPLPPGTSGGQPTFPNGTPVSRR